MTICKMFDEVVVVLCQSDSIRSRLESVFSLFFWLVAVMPKNFMMETKTNDNNLSWQSGLLDWLFLRRSSGCVWA